MNIDKDFFFVILVVFMAITQVEKKLETHFIINKQAQKLINKRRRKNKMKRDYMKKKKKI
jgi:hypothetical protein